MSKLKFIIRSSQRYWSRRPLSALVGILLLCIGTAAITTLWVVTDTLIRQPLPYPESDKLYGLQSIDEKIGKTLPSVSIADFRDFQQNSQAFEAIVGYRGDFLNYKTADGAATQLFGTQVTPDFAKVFQIKPHLGRLFERDDFVNTQATNVILGYQSWQRVFNSDPEIIGKSIQLDDKPYEVIGVLPRTFREPAFSDAWLPFPEGSGEYFVRDSRYWQAVGRLGSGATPASASLELQSIAQNLAQSYPATNKNRGVRIEPLKEILTGDFKKPLIIMLAAVALVLLATCMNLANLQMISGLQRDSENATRLALGEFSSVLFNRTLFESLALCILGCGSGILVAHFIIQGIHNYLPPFFLPRISEIQIDLADAGLIALLILICSLGFGLLPAFQALRGSPIQRMNAVQNRTSLSKGSKRIHSTLLALQIGIAVSILVAAISLHAEYQRLKNLDLGFDEQNTISIAASPSDSILANFVGLANYYHGIETWLAEQPNVTSVTSSSSPPLWGFAMESAIAINGRDLVSERETPATAIYDSVGSDFFDTLKIKLLAGRPFDDRDVAAAGPVCIVNKAFVDEYFSGEDPIGQEVQILPWMQPNHRRIIGVTPNVKVKSLTAEPTPHVYVPALQTPWLFTTFLVKHDGRSDAIEDRLKRALEEREPGLGVSIISMDQLLEAQLAQSSIMMTLLGAFGVIVSILSISSVATISAFNTYERKVEWGIRLALGGTPSHVRGIVVRDMLPALGAGLLIGLITFYATLKLTGSNLGPAMGIDIPTGTLLIGSLTVTCVLVSWILSAHITRLQPNTILKSL